jgi:hypothetical protein
MFATEVTERKSKIKFFDCDGFLTLIVIFATFGIGYKENL